jgi:hypothetical protein
MDNNSLFINNDIIMPINEIFNENTNINTENDELNRKIDINNKLIKKIQKNQEKYDISSNNDENNTEKDTIIVPINKETFLKTKYNILQLKYICKHYKQKVSGTKNELIERITKYFKRDYCIYVIQRFFKKVIYKKYMRLHGPARMNRKICVNETDFFTMEPIKDIHYSQFFSFKDKDNMIYGFDILSLYTLLFNQNNPSNISNPYNRNPFPETVSKDLKKLIKISKILKDNVIINNKEEIKEYVSPMKELELLSISLFQYIDQLGNYTDYKWFWLLGHRKLVTFIHELNDIWCYRSQLTTQMKREICPPNGNPFMNIQLSIVSNNMHLIELKRIALNIIEQMIKRGVSESNRCLGANYVLCALTLVSSDAAIAIPWLYQSVSHI